MNDYTDTVHRMAIRGVGRNQIAKRLCISRNTVSSILKRLGMAGPAYLGMDLPPSASRNGLVDWSRIEPSKDELYWRACRNAGGFPVLHIPPTYRVRA